MFTSGACRDLISPGYPFQHSVLSDRERADGRSSTPDFHGTDNLDRVQKILPHSLWSGAESFAEA